MDEGMYRSRKPVSYTHLDVYKRQVDGRLDAGSRAQLEAHLVICPSCREEYRQISALHRDMQALPEETLPQEARRAYRAEIKKDRGPLQWKRYASVAAVLCMMVAGIYFAQDISRQHEERVENVSSSQGYVNRDGAADAEDIVSEEDAQAQELAKYLYDQGEMMGIQMCIRDRRAVGRRDGRTEPDAV